MSWKPGDACRLINLRKGEVLQGQIEVIRGHHMVVVTDDGRRWSAETDSSFVQRAALAASPAAEEPQP